MRKAIWVVSCLGLCVTVLFAVDEQRLDVKPGLWQFEYKMTAQQKAAMGIEAPKGYKTCIREKDLNKGWTEGNANCPWKVMKSTSSDLELHASACRGDELDLKFHAVDSENVLATMTMHSTGTKRGANVPLDENYNYEGKWLGSTCPADMK